MTTEIVPTEVDDAPPVVLVPETSPELESEQADVVSRIKKKARDKEEAKEAKESKRISPELAAVKTAEDKSLRDIIESIGGEGAFQIRIHRTDPAQMRDESGRMINVAGYLTRTEKAIDEEWLKSHFGGGSYRLEFRKKDPGGGFKIFTHRMVHVSGAPIIEGAPKPAAAAGESTTMVKQAFDVMQKQLDQAREGTGRSSDDPLIKILRDQLDAANSTVNELRKEMREIANKPVNMEDPVKDRLLDKLMTDDSARVNSLRATYESEIRQLKDHAAANEQRIRDGFERDKQDIRNSHEREINMLRHSNDNSTKTMQQSYESSVSALKSSHEVALSAAKSSFETQMVLLKATNDQLTAQIAELRAEVKELRAKKDKGFIEVLKEADQIKELVGGGDDDKGFGEKIADAVTNPEIIGAVTSMFGGGPAAQAQAAQQAAAQQQVAQAQAARAAMAARRPRVVAGPDGQKYMLQNGQLSGPLPAPKRKVPRPPGEGEEGPQVELLPVIDPAILEPTVKFLENAFDGGQDPVVVAQTVRSRVPEDLMAALRDHGVDVVLSKVAKLHSTSPLMSQEGRNWARKLGKALVGE